MSTPTLLVLAAGMGSRYGGLKQIDPVGPHGEAILDYSVYDAMRAGFGRVVFLIRRSIEDAFRASVGSRYQGSLPVEYAFQELEDLPPGFSLPEGREKPWGTTHAVLCAAHSLPGPFAVINADDFYGAASYRVLARHLQSGSPDFAMVGFVLRRTLSAFGSVARGICQVDAAGLLQSVVEHTQITPEGQAARSIQPDGSALPLTGDELVSMNMWGFTPAIFDPLARDFQQFLQLSGSELKSECYLPNSVNTLVASGSARVRMLSSPDAWFGVTYREDRESVVARIAALVQAGDYPAQLWPS